MYVYTYARRSHRFKGIEGYGTVLGVTGEGETVYFCLSFLPSRLVGYLRAKFFSRGRGSARGRARMFVAHFTKTVRSDAIRRWVVQ